MLKTGPPKHEEITHLNIHTFNIKYSLSESQYPSDFPVGGLRLTDSHLVQSVSPGLVLAAFFDWNYKVTDTKFYS